MIRHVDTVCAILAGGKGRRLGGVDKATLKVGDKRLLDHAVHALRPQSPDLAICLQTPTSWATDYDLPILIDRPSTGLGPLGGVSAALHWARHHPKQPKWLVTSPVDCPFLPSNLVEKLTHGTAEIAIATSAARRHFTIAAWPTSLSETLEETLKAGPMSVRAFQADHSVREVLWQVSSIDPFLNINTPVHLEMANQYHSEFE